MVLSAARTGPQRALASEDADRSGERSEALERAQKLLTHHLADHNGSQGLTNGPTWHRAVLAGVSRPATARGAGLRTTRES